MNTIMKQYAVMYHEYLIPRPTTVMQTAIAAEPIIKIFLLPTSFTRTAPRIANTAHATPINIVPTRGEIGNSLFVYS